MSVKDVKGNKLKHGDKVKFICKIKKIVQTGYAYHFSGGSFAIEVPNQTRVIYNNKEIRTYTIHKI